MGTRGFVTFVIDDIEKTTYNHSDSYPDGLGVGVLDFLWTKRHEITCDIHRGVSGGTVDLARKLRVVDEESIPMPEDVEALKKFADTRVGRRSTDDWYCLLRHTQGNPAAMLQAGVVLDAKDFPADSLFAEYGYVVDFDEQRFEVYEGFQRQSHDKGRFAGRDGRGDYFPVALAASWPLAELPTKDAFLAALTDDDEGE
jgi:hypothetical protein